MTLTSTTNRTNYTGNGATVTFAVPFRVMAATDLVVIQTDADTGADTTLSYPTHYSVSGVGNLTGSITLTTAPASGDTLTILRSRPRTQTTSLRNQGSGFPENQESALDSLAMIAQDQQDQLDRSIRVPNTHDPAGMSLELTPETGKALVWQSSTVLGNSTIDTSAIAVPGESRTVATATAYLLNNAVYNVKDYGALGNGSTNDTAAIQAAIDAAGSAGGGLVYVPKGTYIVSAATDEPCLTIDTSHVSMTGDGPRSILKVANNTRVSTLLLVESASPTTEQIQDVMVTDLALDGNKANQTGSYEQKNLRIVPSNQYDAPANIIVRNVYSYSAYSGVLPTEGGGISIEGSDHATPTSTSTLDYYKQRILIDGCICYDNDGWGIGTNWGNTITISNNHCWDNRTMGITAWNSQDIVISNNQCEAGDQGHALNIEASDRVFVTGNILKGIDGNGGCAISVYNSLDVDVDASNYCEHIGNNALHHAIRISSGTGYGDGTFKQRATKRVRIAARVSKTGTDGWAVYCDAPDAATPTQYQEEITVESRDIRNAGNATKGVALQGLKVHLLKSRVTGKVYLDGYTDEAHCDGNQIAASFSSANDVVQLNGGTYVTCNGNTVSCGSNVSSAVRYTGATVTQLDVLDTTVTGAPTVKLALDNAAVPPNTSARFAMAQTGTQGDTSPTLVATREAPTQIFATALTANRTITLASTVIYRGAKFRIVRTGLGAFTLDVGGLKTIPNSTAAFVDVEHDGTNWKLTGYGTL